MSGPYNYIDSEVIVTGDYKYPFKCVRRIITIPRPGTELDSNSNAYALFSVVHVSPSESTGVDANEINLWSDGEIPPDTYVEINLNDGINGSFYPNASPNPNPFIFSDTISVYEYIAGPPFSNAINYLLGEAQPDSLPCTINVIGSEYIYPTITRWKNGTAIFKPKPINKYLPSNIKDTLSITSSYRDSNNISYSCFGTLTKDAYLTDDGSLITPMPQLSYREPLSGFMYIESINGEFIKDGVDSPNLVVESYWKNEPIRKQLKINIGTDSEREISYPLPQIIFKLANSTSETKYIELTSSVVNSEYTRTSIYPPLDGSGGVIAGAHKHACTVDDSGNGITTSMILLTNNSPPINHTHSISDFIATTTLGHIHEISCVAITQIKPTTDTNINTDILAFIPYDPTNAQVTIFPPNFPHITGINRIVAVQLSSINAGIIDPQFPTRPILSIDLYNSKGYGESRYQGIVTDPNTGKLMARYLASQTPYITDNGFDISARVYFSKYLNEDYPGHFVLMPERDVDDGTRLTIENIWMIPDKLATTNDAIVELIPNQTRPYLVLKSNASVTSEGQYAFGNTAAAIDSSLQWIPDVSPIVVEPTQRQSYIIEALNSSSVSNSFAIGPSQIYDGVILAANRMIDFNFSNSNGSSFTKLIILETDGDENLSRNSLAQASKIVNSIEGTNNIPIVSVVVGEAANVDKVLVSKLSYNTGGIVESIRGLSYSGLLDVIKDIFKSTSLSFNEGVFRVIEQVTPGLPIEISLENVIVPSDTSVQYRYRTSSDGINWTEFSGWINYDVSVSLSESMDNLAGYYEYEVVLRANEVFQSPYLTQLPKITHLIPKENIVFFTKNDVKQSSLEYMASILITHSGIVPDTSIITYGLSQSESTDPKDYTIAGNDLRPDKQEILLSRYNELLITSNYKKYMAINGGWVKGSDINVYQYDSSMFNGILVDSSSYSSNYADGTISFISQQSKLNKFIICIGVSPLFKLICKVKNYGTVPAIIEHIGLIYNVAKRIPVSTNGTIMNKNIADRL